MSGNMRHRLKAAVNDPVSATKWNRIVDALPHSAVGNGAGIGSTPQLRLPAIIDPDGSLFVAQLGFVYRITGAEILEDADRYEALENLVIKIDSRPQGAEVANWCVSQQRFSPGDFGIVALSGLCIARIGNVEASDVGKHVGLTYDQDPDFDTLSLRIATPLSQTNAMRTVGRIVAVIEDPGGNTDLAIVLIGPEQEPGYRILYGSVTARSGTTAGVAGGEIQAIDFGLVNQQEYVGTGETMTAHNWSECAFSDRYFQVAKDSFGAWHFAGYDDENCDQY